MTNSVLNKGKLKTAIEKKKKYYFKRSGKCIPSVCSSACCRYTVCGVFGDDYFSKVSGYVRSVIELVKYGKNKYAVSSFHCPDITIDGKCKTHATGKQSPVCDNFPTTPLDAVYIYVKDACTYSFTKTLVNAK